MAGGKHSTPLERGRVKHRLLRELAMAEKTQVDLARQYEVTQGAISQFAKRHLAEIEAIRDELVNDEVGAGLWIAKKRERVATYQDQVEEIEARRAEPVMQALQDYLDDAGDDPVERLARQERVLRALSSDAKWAKLKQDALKNVAEELGQLPPRVAVNVDQRSVKFVIAVEPEELDNL